MELSKNPKCIYKEVDNIGVILEPESGKFIELNKTALIIWNMLDKTNNLTERSSENLISNIRKRDRPFEKSISPEYLIKIEKAVGLSLKGTIQL